MLGSRLVEPGSASVALSAGTSSMYRGGWSGDSWLSINAQTLCGLVKVRMGIAEGLEIDFESCVYSLCKSLKNRGSFGVSVGFDGIVAADLTSQADGGSNPCFTARISLLGGDGGSVPSLTASFAFTIPCGPDRSFARPGAAEVGGFLDASWDMLSPLHVHFSAGWMHEPFLANLEPGPRLDLRDSWFLAFGLELEVSSWMSAHLQFEGMGNPYPRTGNYRLDSHPVQATAALSFRPLKSARVFASFSEDLSRTAPDFAVQAGAEFGF